MKARSRKALILFSAIALILILSSGLIACGKVNFKILFIVDGEVYHTIDTSGEELIQLPENPTKEEHVFLGWFWRDGRPFTINSLQDTPLQADMSVYAHWRHESEEQKDIFVVDGQSEGLNLSFDVDSSTSSVNLTNKLYTLPELSWEMYEDITGQTKVTTKMAANLQNGDNTYYIVVTSKDGKINKTYTLTIHKVYTVTITYADDFGGQETEEVLTHTTLTARGPLTRDGYEFLGWDEEIEGYYVTGPKTFTAVWNYDKYTVTFEVERGAVDDDTMQVKMDHDFEFPVPTAYTEYAFKGWYTEPSGGTQLTKADGTSLNKWNIAENTTVYARWNSSKSSPGGICIGEYPQTLKSDEVQITATQDSRGYYLGNDNSYYAKLVANPYATGYKFSDNKTVVEKNKTYYFKVEPISWVKMPTIMNDQFLSKKVLDNKPFYVPDPHASVDVTKYENSYIRNWLNEEFFNIAFSLSEIEYIQSTDTPPWDEVWTNLSSVGLLTGYFINGEHDVEPTLNDEKRTKVATDYAIASGAEISTTEGTYGNCIWWLRENADESNPHNRRAVDVNGAIKTEGYLGVQNKGIVPLIAQ
ncbi:MAG: InlB B-repeat-containing protein [Christensenellales bacterium]|jgi:hypothetical protein